MRRIIFIPFLLVFIWVIGCEKDSAMEPDQMQSADFVISIENVAEAKDYLVSGVFNTPVGGSAPAPIGPGQAYEFTFDATPGTMLSFATMFVQSNDLFYAPAGSGIALFNGNTPITGDVTDQIKLWDAGSEINQEPGLGTDQAPRQSGPNTGAADPDNTVREAVNTFNNLPVVSDVIKVTLSSTSATGFKVRIDNVSNSSTLMSSDQTSTAVPLAPGVFVIHTGSNPLFSTGQPDAGNGLAAIAEDGDPGTLSSHLAMDTGITQILAPGVWAVHSGDNALFTENQADAGEGMEALAEDGDPSVLVTAVSAKSTVNSSGVFNTPAGAASPGPATPETRYEFSFSAEEGQQLSFATMFVQSNDLFYAPAGQGIDLFDASGNPITGDITTSLMLWDAGTEQNEKPGFGLNQAPRQSGPDTGGDENGNIQMVNDGFDYPGVSQVIKVTLSLQ
jgi:hypothetical protein